jgi:hypothetical protein
LYPNEVPPEDTQLPDLVSEGRLPRVLWDAKAFPRITVPVCGTLKSVPSMDMRQSLPMSPSFLLSKSTCGGGEYTGEERGAGVSRRR